MKTKALVIALVAVLLLGNTVVFAEQGVILLPNVSQQAEESGLFQHFSDVPPTHWAFETVEWGYSNNIASGYGNGKFKPNYPVTQEEFLTLLIRAYNGEAFTATSNERWSDPYYKIAESSNYPVSGQRGSMIKRQSVAELIAGVQGKNYSGRDAIQYMLGNNLAQGKDGTLSISGFAPDDTLTRAEAIQFIRNVLSKTSERKLLARPVTPSQSNELPPLPLSEVRVIGKIDKTLEQMANKINPIAVGGGYCTFYNGDHGAVGITHCVKGDEIPKFVMSYTFIDRSDSYLMAQIHFGFMLLFRNKSDGSGEREAIINDDRLAIAVSALGELGLKLSDANIETIKTFCLMNAFKPPSDVKPIDFAVGGHNTEIDKVSTYDYQLDVDK